MFAQRQNIEYCQNKQHPGCVTADFPAVEEKRVDCCFSYQFHSVACQIFEIFKYFGFMVFYIIIMNNID
jgi:hypothetical protein